MHVAARTLPAPPVQPVSGTSVTVSEILTGTLPRDFVTVTKFTASGTERELHVRWRAQAVDAPFTDDDKPPGIIPCHRCHSPNTGGVSVAHESSDSQVYVMRCSNPRCRRYTLYVKAIFLNPGRRRRPEDMWSTFPGVFAYGTVVLHTMAEFGRQLGATMLLCDDSRFEIPHKDKVVNFRDLYTLRYQEFRTYYSRFGFVPTTKESFVAKFNKQLREKLAKLKVTAIDPATWADLGLVLEDPDESVGALLQRWLPAFRLDSGNLEAFYNFFVQLNAKLTFKLDRGRERTLIETLNDKLSYMSAAAATVYGQTTGGDVQLFTADPVRRIARVKRTINEAPVDDEQRPVKTRKLNKSVTLHFIG